MSFIRIKGGILRVAGGGKPEMPEAGGPPDWGIDEGEPPQVEPPDIEPPPGVWPGPTPGNPIMPVPPHEAPGQPIELPPGSIWPRPPGAVSGLFIVLAHIPGYGWRYIVVDPDGWPPHKPEPPKDRPTPEPGEPLPPPGHKPTPPEPPY